VTAALAIYDLDRTITRVPTWSLFLLFAARQQAPWRLLLIPGVAAVALFKATGVIDRDRLKQWMHRLLLGHRSDPARLAATAEAFADRFVAHDILDRARASIAADRAAGRRIVIATAAHRFYAQPIARRLDVADLIATAARRDEAGRILSTIEGRNCYGAAKLAMIRAWMDEQGIACNGTHIRFYSDHITDRPTFEWADEPVAVNAHPPLARLAGLRGWRQEDWRQRP